MNEADTCRTLVLPKLQAAGWEADPHSIAGQRFVTIARRNPLLDGSQLAPAEKREEQPCSERK